MAAYCDFNEMVEKLYHIIYGMFTNSYIHSYKYENHVFVGKQGWYWHQVR